MTAHELAKLLLQEPDLPIVTVDFTAKAVKDALVPPRIGRFTNSSGVKHIEIFASRPVLATEATRKPKKIK